MRRFNFFWFWHSESIETNVRWLLPYYLNLAWERIILVVDRNSFVKVNVVYCYFSWHWTTLVLSIWRLLVIWLINVFIFNSVQFWMKKINLNFKIWVLLNFWHERHKHNKKDAYAKLSKCVLTLWNIIIVHICDWGCEQKYSKKHESDTVNRNESVKNDERSVTQAVDQNSFLWHGEFVHRVDNEQKDHKWEDFCSLS